MINVEATFAGIPITPFTGDTSIRLYSKSDVAVILNGPPGCGKDTIAKLLCDMTIKTRCIHSGGYVAPECHKGMPCTFCGQAVPLVQRAMKSQLYKATADYYKVDVDQFIYMASDRILKEQPSELLGGLSPRSALIHVSEDVAKPTYGLDYFGRQEAAEVAFERMALMPHFDAIYSDGGFIEEVTALKEVFKKICVIRLHREDCSFKGDSRTYLYPVGIEDVHSCDVILTIGNIQSGVSEVLDIYKRLKVKCN